jgi:hypothetical protein
MIPKSGYRFSACAKPCQQLVPSIMASAGEATSEKIMLKRKAKAKCEINSIHFALAPSLPRRRLIKQSKPAH